MANKFLYVEKNKFQGQIDELDTYLNELDTTLQKYQAMESSMDKFIESTDDNYDTIRQNLRTNIATVKNAKQMTEDSLKALRATLEEFETIGNKIGDIASNAADAAKNTLSAAIEAMKLVD